MEGEPPLSSGPVIIHVSVACCSMSAVAPSHTHHSHTFSTSRQSSTGLVDLGLPGTNCGRSVFLNCPFWFTLVSGVFVHFFCCFGVRTQKMGVACFFCVLVLGFLLRTDSSPHLRRFHGKTVSSFLACFFGFTAHKRKKRDGRALAIDYVLR
ncbi:hypothetical protein B0T10DRAFT_219463 [Thelonectria olida]|uniref:Transmembrane protein n=1 Tax=Thelonectria olida TaxID=1576542 RepID=A0A9P8WBI2_9HYPO|nr:hypothetical protein B0T10DRAFT_219463 [Thelonectria olida]